MIPNYLSPLANHLWQSTIFAAAVLLLAALLRRNRAQARYWLWLAASVKFLLPFSLLVKIGGLFEWSSAPVVAPALNSAVEQISQPFAPAVFDVMPSGSSASLALIPWLLVAAWFAGFATIGIRWLIRWCRIRAAVRSAIPIEIVSPIAVKSSATLLEPGVFGIFRPVLLLPAGIAARLSPAQLRAILAHELCHVRRRDNLAAALHMLVEAIFWFHPLVWWIGARMVEERERACDEEVLRLGNEPQAYAEGILNVCKFYLESPLPCASGVTGSDLKKRIEAIMTNRISRQLTLGRRLMLVTAALAAIAGPVVIGTMRAQSKPEAAFEVASIKPADPDARGISIHYLPGGGLRATNVRLRQLVEFAYEVNKDQIIGITGWMESQGFDLLAKGPQSAEALEMRQMTEAQRKAMAELVRQRLRALLKERFQLEIRKEAKEVPVFALVVAKNGHKLKASADADGSPQASQHMRTGRGEITAERIPVELFANHLGRLAGRPVLDKTGLKGPFDFKLEWTPEMTAAGDAKAAEDKAAGAPAADPGGPSLFTALQDQLGLKLESQKAPVDHIAIVRAEKPTEN